MRIAELVNNLELGGAERMLADLSIELRARGHYVHVICLRGEGPLAEPLRQKGINVSSLNKSSTASLPIVRKLGSVLLAQNIEVLHTHNPLVHHYGVVAGWRAGVRALVSTLHGPGNLDELRSRILYDVCCLGTSRVVSVCESLERRVHASTSIAWRRSTVIPNGIDMDRFLAVSPRESAEPFTFGTVGRLAPVKDHANLLKAFRLVLERYPASRLEILGDGPLREELRAISCSLRIDGQVGFHGASLDVPGFLGKLNAFVLASLYEGLPITMIEAMAAGLPVVGTEVGGISEMVKGSGCGWLSPPGRPELLANALCGAIESNDRRQLGEAGRSFARNRYSLKTMTDSYERLFAELIAGAAGRSERLSSAVELTKVQ